MAVERPLGSDPHIAAVRKKRFPARDVEARIGYAFERPDLLQRALTHVSAVPNDPGKAEIYRAGSYQRLEYLGDRVLGLAVASMLYEQFPDADEGELSQRLAVLVREETCAGIAAALDLGASIRLGAGEANAGGRKREAVLADVCESVIGAVYLDGGFEVARQFVQREWRTHMITPPRPLRDPKTTLQEWAQARGLPPPSYEETGRAGPDHKPLFRIAVTVEGLFPAEGEGGSKRFAEQAAASALLRRENIVPDAADAG